MKRTGMCWRKTNGFWHKGYHYPAGPITFMEHITEQLTSDLILDEFFRPTPWPEKPPGYFGGSIIRSPLMYSDVD